VSIKILIVDDEPSLLRIISYALEAEGYEIVTAENGAEALIKVKANQPDLLILDVKLPEISGIEVCRQLRTDPEMVGLPIIMLSARIQIADKIAGLKVGADEYITKPVDTDELVARVAALLERTRRLRDTQPVQRGKVLTFVGAKGGIGATTVALNFAAALTKQMKTVIMVELTSSYGALALQLQHQPSKNLGNLLKLEPARIDQRELAECLRHLPFGLSVLFSPQGFAELQQIQAEQAAAVITALAKMADCVIIDLPDFPLAACPHVIQQTDFTFLVVEPEPVAVGLGKVKHTLVESWSAHRESIGVIVNRTTALLSMTSHEVEQELGCRIIGVIPPAPDAMEAAQKQGAPLVICQPEHLVSTVIYEMASQIAGIRFWI
jgi:DNA-binding response OmpR family regulator